MKLTLIVCISFWALSGALAIVAWGMYLNIGLTREVGHYGGLGLMSLGAGGLFYPYHSMRAREADRPKPPGIHDSQGGRKA